MRLMRSWFDPAEPVLLEQLITGMSPISHVPMFRLADKRCRLLGWYVPLRYDVATSQGAADTPVLDQLFYTLMDEGEAILLAAP